MNNTQFLIGLNLGIDANSGLSAVITTPVTIDPCDEDHMDSFNCTKEAFILHERGRQIQNLSEAIPVTLLYMLTFLAGIIGNSLVCIVIVRHSSMHTATNYYLFNLAISDMVYLIFGLPFEILLFWHQYPWLFGLPFCKFRALIAEACSYVSVLTIVAFSMERFLAICYPLHSYAMSGLKRVVRLIAIIWLFSLISATPFAIFRKIFYIRYPPKGGDELPESSLCATLAIPAGLYELSTVVFFAIPMIIIIVLYIFMAIEIRSRSKHSANKQLGIHPNSINVKQTKSRRAIVKMLAVVVVTFFISWAPFHAQRVIIIYGRDWQNFESINKFLFTASGFFYYFACTINPIIYNMMSHRYRFAFRETLCGKKINQFLLTPRQLSRKTTDSSTSTTREHLIAVPMVDPFDAETGAFSRTRSLRLSQSRKSQMQRNNSTNSRIRIGRETNVTNPEFVDKL